MNKLNLGCGTNHRDGYVNVDKYAPADQIVDLEKFPWPWANDSVDEVVMYHVLEHMGETTEVFKQVMQELYRVVRHSGHVIITVPHPRHDHFLIDPTHVRPVMMEFMPMISKKVNDDWISKGLSSSPLAIHWGVNFDLEKVEVRLDDFAKKRIQNEIEIMFGTDIPPSITDQLLTPRAQILSQRENNVVKDFTVTLRVVK